MSDNPPKRYGCAMVHLSPVDSWAMQEWARTQLDADELSYDEDGDGGIEDKPHITVLYGLDGVTADQVRGVVASRGTVEATVGPLSLFELGECDVLKYDIYSDDLRALNESLKQLPFVATHPEYIPHATMAYVRKGAGDRFDGQDGPLTGQRMTFDVLTYSDADKNATVIELTAKKHHSVSERETKILPVANFKALSEGAGGGEGYPSVFWDLDEVGDIICPGAYTKRLPQFLKNGFIACAHDWDEAVGYPVEAREDGYGLFSRWLFHSTPDSQSARMKAAERAQADLSVPLSIGFICHQSLVIDQTNYATELPKLIPPDRLAAVMEKANRFYQVRLLQDIELFEFSLVTVPALRSAAATGIKGIGEAADLPLETHLRVVADATGEVERRVRARHELRLKEGRRLSAQTIGHLKETHTHMQNACEKLGGLLAEVEPEEDEKGVSALEIERLRLQVSMGGEWAARSLQ